METYLDPCLAEEEDIYFQAGNHHELVRMKVADYQRIARPRIAGACLHREVTVVT
jgi:prolyl-tRNA editing enzyme YbaK/EbsC (Cys-tRNA(Pro) deacylase)